MPTHVPAGCCCSCCCIPWWPRMQTRVERAPIRDSCDIFRVPSRLRECALASSCSSRGRSALRSAGFRCDTSICDGRYSSAISQSVMKGSSLCEASSAAVSCWWSCIDLLKLKIAVTDCLLDCRRKFGPQAVFIQRPYKRMHCLRCCYICCPL